MAVVRIKRRFDEEPKGSLILACKRRKTEEDALTSLFKFAATVKDQNDICKHISSAVQSSKSQSTYKTPNITNITEKLRAENKLFSQNSRLKVVNCLRALDGSLDSFEDSESASGNSWGLTIVDIESIPSCTSESPNNPSEDTVSNDTSQDYVYDIYYAHDCKLDDINPVSCHALEDLVFEDHCNDYNAEEESDDSNDENNWRNDYPDEDPDSIGEEDMKLACGIGGLNIDETNSLSSDNGEEDLVYGVDEPGCVHGIDPTDEDYFGSNYAAYKKRVKKHLLCDDSDSENSDFYGADSNSESD